MNSSIPVEFNNQRIMTTKVLAEEFGATEKNLLDNFSNNKTRFIEGKHYFKLEGERLKEFKAGLPDNIGDPLKFTSKLILWTEKGAARHAKILETDEAWQIYEKLEDTYFRVKEAVITLKDLSPELQMFQQLFNVVAQSQLEQKKLREEVLVVKEQSTAAAEKAQVLEHRINNLDASNITGTQRQRLNAMIKKFAFDKGVTIPSAWHEFRKAFNTAYRTNIEQKKTNYQGKYGNKALSYPDYLEKVGLIEDALRIADKMIN